MAFDVGKVGNSLWPEVGGIAALFGAKMVARYVDETYALTKVMRRSQDYVDLAAVGIPVYLIGTGSKATESSEAVLFAMSGIFGQRLADNIYTRTVRKGAKQISNRKLAGNPNAAIAQAEQAKAIAQARQNALAAAGKSPVAVVAVGDEHTSGGELWA